MMQNLSCRLCLAEQLVGITLSSVCLPGIHTFGSHTFKATAGDVQLFSCQKILSTCVYTYNFIMQIALYGEFAILCNNMFNRDFTEIR